MFQQASLLPSNQIQIHHSAKISTPAHIYSSDGTDGRVTNSFSLMFNPSYEHWCPFSPSCSRTFTSFCFLTCCSTQQTTKPISTNVNPQQNKFSNPLVLEIDLFQVPCGYSNPWCSSVLEEIVLAYCTTSIHIYQISIRWFFIPMWWKW